MVGIEKLIFLRKHYGLRQVDIADYIGISLSMVKLIETWRQDITQEQHDKWLEACRVGHKYEPKPVSDEDKYKVSGKRGSKKRTQMGKK